MINEQSTITLHFELSLENGEVIDSTFGKQAATFQYGDGSLLPGFEQCLLGLQPGDSKTFMIEQKDAFGARNPQNIQNFKRETFAENVELAEGLIVSFADAGGNELPGVVRSFTNDEVIVDFNHPLAGETLNFKVEIINVE